MDSDFSRLLLFLVASFAYDAQAFAVSHLTTESVYRNSWRSPTIVSSARDNQAVTKNVKERTVEFELLPSITGVSPDVWDACLTESSSPFLHHSWLRCLEESKCSSPSTGWVPQHVVISIDKVTAGFVPLYIKGHSLGEFIFDQQFAEAAYQNGIQYYPKLLVGVPFTPATGQRILWNPEHVQHYSRAELGYLNRAVGNFLKQIAVSNQLSSVHFNFLTDDEATDLGGPLGTPLDKQQQQDSKSIIQSKIQTFLQRLDVKDDYLRRSSLQYHWTNSNPNNHGRPFRSFDEYLECFKSKKRINIKRERRKVLEDENIKIDIIVGRDILQYPGLVERMFEIYVSTIDKMVWGRQYLTLEFFQLLAKSDFIQYLVFVCARNNVAEHETLNADDVFAGTFNIVKDGVFYGRYWGCLPDREVKNLHFECCYWSAIDFCIKNGLRRIEPGAGGGDYKWARGFDPSLIHSVHYISHPGLRRAIHQFLVEETESNVELTQYLLKKSAVGGSKAAAAKSENVIR